MNNQTHPTQKDEQNSTTDNMTHDDLTALQSVLQSVKGAYPDAPFKQSDYLNDPEA